MPDVPSIPPLTPLDTQTQRVIKPLVDGWEVRNGNSTKAFVTVQDVLDAASLYRTGSGGSVSDGKVSANSRAASALAGLAATAEHDAGDTDARLDRIESDQWFRTRYDQYAKDTIRDLSTGAPVSRVETSSTVQNVKAYASDGTSTGLTLDLAAGTTVFMNGTLTLRRNPEYNPYQWVTLVTDVKTVDGQLQVTKRDIRTIVDGDVSNGGWLFCWIEVENTETGASTRHGYSLHVPHGAVFLKAPVHAVATCSVTGTYRFRVVADGANAKYGFGDIKGTQRVPLSVVVCG